MYVACLIDKLLVREGLQLFGRVDALQAEGPWFGSCYFRYKGFKRSLTARVIGKLWLVRGGCTDLDESVAL